MRINCRYAPINAYVSTYILGIHSHMWYLYLYVHLINIIPTYYYYSIFLIIICTVSTLSCTVHTPHISASHSDISREKIYYLLLYVSSMVYRSAYNYSLSLRESAFVLKQPGVHNISSPNGFVIEYQFLNTPPI